MASADILLYTKECPVLRHFLFMVVLVNLTTPYPLPAHCFSPLPVRTPVTPWPLEKADLPELTYPVWASGHATLLLRLSKPQSPEGRRSPFPLRILKFLVPASQSLQEKAISTKTASLPEDGACVCLSLREAGAPPSLSVTVSWQLGQPPECPGSGGAHFVSVWSPCLH